MAGGELGPAAAGGRVIYAQTDSLFLLLPKATPPQAVQLGKQVRVGGEGRCLTWPTRVVAG